MIINVHKSCKVSQYFPEGGKQPYFKDNTLYMRGNNNIEYYVDYLLSINAIDSVHHLTNSDRINLYKSNIWHPYRNYENRFTNNTLTLKHFSELSDDQLNKIKGMAEQGGWFERNIMDGKASRQLRLAIIREEKRRSEIQNKLFVVSTPTRHENVLNKLEQDDLIMFTESA